MAETAANRMHERRAHFAFCPLMPGFRNGGAMRRNLGIALGVAAGAMAGLFLASRRGKETSARLREFGQGMARRAATPLHTLAAAARVWHAGQEPATRAPGPCEPTL